MADFRSSQRYTDNTDIANAFVREIKTQNEKWNGTAKSWPRRSRMVHDWLEISWDKLSLLLSTLWATEQLKLLRIFCSGFVSKLRVYSDDLGALGVFHTLTQLSRYLNGIRTLKFHRQNFESTSSSRCYSAGSQGRHKSMCRVKLRYDFYDAYLY